MKRLEIVEDAGISAKNLRRPGAQRVIEMARNKMVEAVVVSKMDRVIKVPSKLKLFTKISNRLLYFLNQGFVDFNF